MSILLLIGGSLLLYLIAYFTYGRWLARRVFRLDSSAQVPSKQFADGHDYVPTRSSVVFGHHFTSIAGTGPIVGPALAVIWGWVPALLWVLFGSIFIGALHDFAALVVSLRNKGKTVGEIAATVIHPRARLLFLLILFLALTIVLAIFGLVIAAVFRAYPEAILPCLLQIPLSLLVGLVLHRKGQSILLSSILVLLVMYATVYFGDMGWAGELNRFLAGMSIMSWVVVLLLYSYLASVLPVWTLLQPRDYINSLQLLTTLSAVLVGLVAAAIWGVGVDPLSSVSEVKPSRMLLENAAPAFRWNPPGAPMIFPFLFVTIACGAISGFHCLVSSGTSSKQLSNEKDAQLIGYGAMLTEGFLAVLVIFACVAGIGLGVAELRVDEASGKLVKSGQVLYGEAAYLNRYESWSSAKGLTEKVGAFVEGAANFLRALHIPSKFALALMGVFVASFAATTLDTACRLQRYVIQELAGSFKPKPMQSVLAPLRNKHGATLFAVLLAGGIAALPATQGAPMGTGGLLLWSLFGATNQLLAGLALLVVLLWMRRRGMPIWFIIPPALLMLLLPAWAMAHNVLASDGFLAKEQYLLAGMGLMTLLLEFWVIIEAWRVWRNINNSPEGQLVVSETKNDGGRSC